MMMMMRANFTLFIYDSLESARSTSY